MLSYKLDEEHEELRKSVEEFARDAVARVIGDLYERGEFPYDIVAKMGRMGLFGLPVPEEYGGMGGDYLALCLALEELARWIPRSRSRWRPASGSASCRCSGSAARSRSAGGCPPCARARSSARSG